MKSATGTVTTWRQFPSFLHLRHFSGSDDWLAAGVLLCGFLQSIYSVLTLTFCYNWFMKTDLLWGNLNLDTAKHSVAMGSVEEPIKNTVPGIVVLILISLSFLHLLMCSLPFLAEYKSNTKYLSVWSRWIGFLALNHTIAAAAALYLLSAKSFESTSAPWGLFVASVGGIVLDFCTILVNDKRKREILNKAQFSFKTLDQV